MNVIDTIALNAARARIRHDLGDISDLPEDMQNTIANVYYEYSYLHGVRDTSVPMLDAIAMAGDSEQKRAEFVKDAAFLDVAVANLGQIICGFRQIRDSGSKEGYELTVSVFRDMLKFRIPDVHKKSSIRVKLERPFYAKKVREIPDLWRLL